MNSGLKRTEKMERMERVMIGYKKKRLIVG